MLALCAQLESLPVFNVVRPSQMCKSWDLDSSPTFGRRNPRFAEVVMATQLCRDRAEMQTQRAPLLTILHVCGRFPGPSLPLMWTKIIIPSKKCLDRSFLSGRHVSSLNQVSRWLKGRTFLRQLCLVPSKSFSFVPATILLCSSFGN